MQMIEIGLKDDGTCMGLSKKMLNRHGIISGATGTGKTVTLKLMIEQLSQNGIPTFVVDVKGDLNAFEKPGEWSENYQKRLELIGVTTSTFDTFPVNHWDVFGKCGLPMRTTVSNMGPLLFSKLLGLNDIQTSILHAVFQIADAEGLLLLDMKDLKSLLTYVYDHNTSFSSEYGLLNKASLGAINRQLNMLDQQEVSVFFGEEALSLSDFEGKRGDYGIINRLDATKLYRQPKLYATVLLWLLSELYEHYEEVGDVDQPRMVFFFDEAHLIFEGIAPVLLNQIEQVVRLIRSKGIGIYFITQMPTDLPDSVLSQLGNRIQHGLRAYTPKEINQLKLAVQGYRANPDLDLYKVFLELGLGEAVVSFLDDTGVPSVSERVWILPPKSYIGAAVDMNYFNNQSLYNKYYEVVDRASAYERLAEQTVSIKNDPKSSVDTENKSVIKQASKPVNKTANRAGRKPDDFLTKITKSFVNSLSRSVGSSLARGLLGTLKKL